MTFAKSNWVLRYQAYCLCPFFGEGKTTFMRDCRRAITLTGVAAFLLASSWTALEAQSKAKYTKPPGVPQTVETGAVNIDQVPGISLSSAPAGLVLSMPPGGAPSSAIFQHPTWGLNSGGFGVASNGEHKHYPKSHNSPSKIPGLDTVPAFTGTYLPQAGPFSAGLPLFPYSIVGSDPAKG